MNNESVATQHESPRFHYLIIQKEQEGSNLRPVTSELANTDK